jgi:4-aminobutyrate aminotransferase/(S)-3-amino-2-methylpropionate transaminase
VIGKRSVIDKAMPGSLGGTFAGNPLACAASLAVFDIIRDEGLLDRATAIGQRLTAGLSSIAARNDVPPIGAVRGLGAMVAFEVFKPEGDRVPDPETTKAIATRAAAEGLLLLPCGYWGNTIRIAPPLTTPDSLLDEGLDRLTRALTGLQMKR